MFQNYGSYISCGVIRDIKLGAKYFLTLTSYNGSMSKASVKLGLVIETGICYAKSKQDGQSVA